jgi:hypothetical protein
MKVDWDKIISENHKPSRASRSLAKMVGGGWDDVNKFFDSGVGQAFLFVTGLDQVGLTPPSRDNLPDPNPNFVSYLDHYTTPAERQARLFEQNRNRALERLRTSEIPKEIKQQEEEFRRGRENEARALLLRNEQSRKGEAARLLARQQTTAAQNAARLQAAQQGATNLKGYLEKIKAVTAASAATRTQNLQSLHALANQKAAAAAAEAEQQRAIQANSAQVLIQQNAEIARLRAEAMAKQAKIAAPSAYMTVAARKGKAPQVKFGGLRYY